MNYANATPSKLFAVIASTAITAVVTASILVGMAGLPSQGNAQQLAATPLHSNVQG